MRLIRLKDGSVGRFFVCVKVVFYSQKILYFGICVQPAIYD